MRKFRSIILFLIIILAIAPGCGNYVENKNYRLFYNSDAVQPKAQKLMTFFSDRNFFSRNLKKAKLKIANDIVYVRFSPQKSKLKDQRYLKDLEKLARETSLNCFRGKEFHFVLDSKFCIKKHEITVFKGGLGKNYNFPGGTFLYHKDIPDSLALRVGTYLAEKGYFSILMPCIQITKPGERYLAKVVSLKFIKDDTALINPSIVFSEMLSDSFFNSVPVDVELCNRFFQTVMKVEAK